MNRPAATDPFHLPRLSRARTRPSDRARWADLLAQFAFAALIVLALAGPYMTIAGGPRLSQLREIGYAVVLALALVSIRPWRQPERLLVVPWPILLALGWCWLSLVWAVDPIVGLRRLVLTTIVLWSVFALVRQLGIERTVAIVRVLLAVLLVVNFAVALAYPAIGIHPPTDESNLAGDWRGVMGQKNFAGLSCAITILFCAFGAWRVPIVARIAVAVAATLFLVLSDSATSLGMCVGALAGGALFAWGARLRGQRQLAPPVLAWIPLVLLGALFVVMALDPAPVLQAISNPIGFTGRFAIWTGLVQAYHLRPWLGVGYGSAWDLGPEGPLAPFLKDWMADQSQGHNGYLDMLVQVGALGTLVMLFAVLVWPVQRLLRGGDSSARILGAALLLFLLGHNFTESSLFDRDALGQVFLMMTIALLWSATAASAHTGPGGGVRKLRRRSGTKPARARTRG